MCLCLRNAAIVHPRLVDYTCTVILTFLLSIKDKAKTGAHSAFNRLSTVLEAGSRNYAWHCNVNARPGFLTCLRNRIAGSNKLSSDNSTELYKDWPEAYRRNAHVTLTVESRELFFHQESGA